MAGLYNYLIIPVCGGDDSLKHDKQTLQDYSDYVKKDLSVYEEENTWDAFSMYNHSFDGGESWVEFDDEVTMIATDEGEETTE